jgi:hypothetical protein
MRECLSVLCATIFFPALAQAAATTAPTFACRSQEDALKARDLASPKAKPGALTSFQSAKTSSGDCVILIKGLAVSVDEKKPPFFCVRLTGSLDCYWAADNAIDLNPPEPEKSRYPRVGKRSVKF